MIWKHLAKKDSSPPTDQRDLTGALLDVLHRLLRAIRKCAIRVDEESYRKFRLDLEKLERQLGEKVNPDEVYYVGGAAVQALEDYAEVATRITEARQRELHEIIALLADTVASLTSEASRAGQQLQRLEEKLERAVMLEDLRTVRLQLAEVLKELREERQRQQIENQKLAKMLQVKLENAGQTPASPNTTGEEPPGTGTSPAIYDRPHAEQALLELYTSPQRFLVVVVVIQNLVSVNNRYGRIVGDQLLRTLAGLLVENFGNLGRIFRWSGPAFLLIVARQVVSAEILLQRLASVLAAHPAIDIQLENRVVRVHLNVKYRHFEPEAFSAAELIEALDKAAAG